MRRIAPLLAAGLAAVTAIGCASRTKTMGVELRSRPRLEAEMRIYRRLEPERALAIAGDPEGRFVTGYAYDRPTMEAAIQEALDSCEERRAELEIQGACRIHARGGEIVTP